LYEVIIPKVGMGITEVEISKWEIKVGETIKKGDPLVEINTEKASAVIDSEYSGTIKELLYNEGDMVEVDSVICVIE
jgi:pyruvate/2-oxoglutarate dehydrogenase complex dihydrolipoamide acyltransferase (E2) component